jgi:hypothetical protein
MFQKEEEMKAPTTTWYEELLATPKHWTPAHEHRGTAAADGAGAGAGAGDESDDADDALLPHLLEEKDPVYDEFTRHSRSMRAPIDPSLRLGKLWDRWNCSLHLRRVAEISRGSAACRLVDQHVHRRLTHHMLRHIVDIGRALPNDMEKFLYLEELMPPPVPILPPDDDADAHSRALVLGSKNMRWSLLGNRDNMPANASANGSKHNVYIPKRLKDATYADLLHISTARATNNAKRIAANVTAAADNRRALGSLAETGVGLHSTLLATVVVVVVAAAEELAVAIVAIVPSI